MRLFAAVFLVCLSTLIGFLLGESGLPLWHVAIIATAVVMLCLGVAASPKQWFFRIASGVTTVALYAFALLIGQQSFLHAFAECLEKGEEVRSSLSRYYREMKKYPESLAQLNVQLPCSRITGQSILDYAKTDKGYALSYGDWLIEYTATETEPFIAHK